jgi:hypothetical protein
MHSLARKWMLLGWLALVWAFAYGCSDDEGQGAAGVGSTDAAADQSKAPEAAPEDTGSSQDLSVAETHDAGVDSSSDGGADVLDAASDAAAAEADAPTVDAPKSDGGPTLLQAGVALTIKGITADDYVVYFDNVARTYYAVPLAGGTPTLLFALPPGGNSFVNVFGKIVFLQTWGSTASYISQLTIWSSALGQPVPISNTALLQFAQTVWASDDSKSIAYVRVTNDQQTIGALYGLDADGTNSTLLVGNLALMPPSCVPRMTFPGGGYAVATYCAAPVVDDAGADGGPSDAGADVRPVTPPPTREIRAFSIANQWSSTLMVTNSLATYAVDPATEQLVTASAATSGHLQAFSLRSGTAGVVLDPDTAISNRQFLFGGKSSPWYVAYNTDMGALKRTGVVAAPSPETLAPSGITYFLTSSRDGNWLVVANTLNSVLFGDLSVVSSRTANTSELVATSAQFANRPLAVSARPGGAFTTDQKYALFFSDAIQNRQGSWIGYVRAKALGSPDAADSVKRLSIGYGIDLFNLAGSRVLLVDNYQESDAGAAPTVDIVFVDPASADSPRVIAAGALGVAGIGGAVSLSSDQSKVVYSTLLGQAPGIYVAPLP